MHVKSLISAFCLGILLLPAMASAADKADQKGADKQTVSDTPFVIVAPSEEIIVTFPLFDIERGIVESIDEKDHTFTLKEKDGTMTKIKVTDSTLVENVYADIFTFETKKGLADLKKGDKVRARVFPSDGEEAASAISVDVYKW